ncbi:MAG: FHA domain-containing protein, partial [Planctomycetes bacterium]|nr:FHA domain-containing protein [Planctomycetota bacterium]
MPYLDIKLGTDSLLVRFVGRIDYVVGRLPKADVQLRDMSVSRLHVQFFIDSRGQCFVRDLGSSGGTLVNDTPLSNALARLHDGSRIRCLKDFQLHALVGRGGVGSVFLATETATGLVVAVK